jgi:hypothetical protein
MGHWFLPHFYFWGLLYFWVKQPNKLNLNPKSQEIPILPIPNFLFSTPPLIPLPSISLSFFCVNEHDIKLCFIYYFCSKGKGQISSIFRGLLPWSFLRRPCILLLISFFILWHCCFVPYHTVQTRVILYTVLEMPQIVESDKKIIPMPGQGN